MKKFIYTSTIVFLLVVAIFTNNVFADQLESFNVEVDKTIVKPGEQVTVKVNFGAQLGAYTITIDYDDDILEFVSTDAGSHSDIDGKIKVVYSDPTGGSNTKDTMSVTFKPKDNIVTSNPTEFSITATGMSSGDTRTTYDEISSPHVKEITVEPNYKDYILNLQYEGPIVAGQEKDMIISFASEMGKNYKQARLVAEATMPEGAEIKLVGKHTDGIDYDIIKTGWGDPQGYEIGGANITQNLNFKGTFSQNGKYTITLKLIDRLASNSVIAEKTFDINVGEETENLPAALPKTGINIYIPFAILGLVLVIGMFVIYNQTSKRKH